MFENSKWIWACNSYEKNQHANFFFETCVSQKPDSVKLNIACETKYYLFVNKNLAVFDGGLFRESLPGCGYYETVDIGHLIREGKN